MESSELTQRVSDIEKRNARVELDKAWETSFFRRVLIAALTYIIVVTFSMIADLPSPLTNALVPTIGFVLSTLTISVVKRWWVARHNVKEQTRA